MKSLLAVLALCLSSAAFAKEIPPGFKQEKVKVDDVTLNVYKGGSGDAVLLIHGYAQSALMWTPVMNALKSKFTVIVPDLRGGGLSDAPATGYDKVTMAADLKKLLDHYKITKARVVGHDIGLMVAYAFAAKYPATVEKLAVVDAFVPGVGSGDAIYNSPDIWHFRFHGEYPEMLVKGRERIFLDSLWEGFSARAHSFPEADKKYYAAQYARPGRMRAGWEYFKAFPQDAADNRELAKTKLPMPVFAMGGAKTMGQQLIDSMKTVSDNVQGKVVENCGHWMFEECPQEAVSALQAFL